MGFQRGGDGAARTVRPALPFAAVVPLIRWFVMVNQGSQATGTLRVVGIQVNQATIAFNFAAADLKTFYTRVVTVHADSQGADKSMIRELRITELCGNRGTGGPVTAEVSDTTGVITAIVDVFRHRREVTGVVAAFGGK